MLIAAQFFTLREFTKTGKDFADALKRCRDIGYTSVQLSGVKCMGGDAPEVTAADCRAMLDDLGMSVCATHRSWDDVAEKTDQEIEFHKTVGCDFLAIGGMPKPYRGQGAAGFREWLEIAPPVIAKLKDAGIRFGYHNHAWEFARDETGARPYDVLVEEGGEDLKMEVDTYWVAHAGANPTTYLTELAGRVPVIHFKDKMVLSNKETTFCPIGEGNLHWDEILAACKSSNVEAAAIEIDRCPRDEFDCMKSSWDFLKAQGL
jgi:sugar phosphate isomerase/epimerase